MARLYSNENFPLPVVVGLRGLGHDVLTTAQAGKSGLAIPDEAVLEFASAERRAVLTLNRKHFIRLHALRPNHGGIVVCTFDPDFAGQVGRIDEALRGVTGLTGLLIRVNRPSS